jgi:hypothetical protein
MVVPFMVYGNFLFALPKWTTADFPQLNGIFHLSAHF